ncbi:MAG: sugar nucleotide-binding protein [Verrucomicrobia bacterium]|nr:sugar nucleotide-binding protein [Verrucomicrobiota bacterium]
MILLLGASGYVGAAFQRYFTARSLTWRGLDINELDCTNLNALTAFLQREHPTFLINCAGYTGGANIEACETHKADCLLGNAVLPGVIREACQRIGLPWGHVSTGCIYNGARPDGSGFREDDPPNFTFRQNNCSFYSGSKALGEEVLAGAADCFIWRLRIPFNEQNNPRNYLAKLMRYDKLVDVRNSISQLDEFVRACCECWEQRVPFGTYNVTNPGSITTREVAALMHKTGACTKQFQFFQSESEFLQKATKTPRANCVLDSGKLLATGIRLTEIHEAVETALRNWKV